MKSLNRAMCPIPAAPRISSHLLRRDLTMTQALTIDSELFGSEAVAPETAAFNAQLEAQLAAVPGLYDPQNAPDYRALSASLNPAVASAMAQERTLDGPNGPIPVRVFVPDTVSGVYLDFHGSGFVINSAVVNDQQNERMAIDASVAVVSVDYRKAPEHPYPEPVDDCEAAAIWLANNARTEFGVDRVVVGGSSTGAYMAAATVIRLRDRHDFTGFGGAILNYGVYDLGFTPSLARSRRDLVLGPRLVAWFFDQFLPAGTPRQDPDVSPLYADLHNLPAALFSVGTLDPVLDDAMFMAARWVAAGNRAELAIYPGGVHGFDGFPLAIAERARGRMAAFIRSALAETLPD